MADLTPLPADELEAALEQAQPGPGGLTFLNAHSLTDAYFDSSVDFSERFIDNVVFERCRFEAVPLLRSNLSNIRFLHCEFVSCNFAKSELSSNVFDNCRFQDSRFQRTMFSDCEFTDTAFSDCFFFAKSWFGGTATRTSFGGSGEQPNHIDDLISIDVAWNITPQRTGMLPEPDSPADTETEDSAGEQVNAQPVEAGPRMDQLLSTLLLVAVERYDQRPIADDPIETLALAFRQFDRLGHPVQAVIEALSPYQRLSLAAGVGKLCGLAITHKAQRYLSAAMMVYEIGAAEDDWRQSYMRLGLYVHTENRLAEFGMEVEEPFSWAPRFKLNREQFIESLGGNPVSIKKYGFEEVVVDGITKFAPIA